MNIEKNDIDISKLFEFSRKFTLTGVDGTEFITYVKIIGDEDLNRVRVHAIRESSKLRKNLYDTKWEDREAYLPDISKYKKDRIINVVVSLELQDITDKAIKKVDIELTRPKELGSEPTLKEQEEYQEAVDKWPEDFNKMVTDIVTESLEKKRKELGKATKKLLLEFYQDALVEASCNQILNKRFGEESSYLGTYIDEDFSIRLFSTLEEFLNTSTKLKDLIITNYRSLELSSQDLKA